MDLSIKTKPFEIDALLFLDENCPCPELYRGKYPGFQHALKQIAEKADSIPWKEVYRKLNLQKFFDGDNFEKSSDVTHLTVNREEFATVANSIKKCYEKDKIMNSFVIRCILKYVACNLKINASDENAAEPSLADICKNQLLIIQKLEEIAELLKKST